MSKFRFWMDYTNAREKNYGASVSDGYAVHVRGWDAGIQVTPRIRGREDVSATTYTDTDEFDVYMTWGSHGGDRSVQIGTVRDTTDGPVWIPAGSLPGTYASAGAPPRLRAHKQHRGYQASRETTSAETATGNHEPEDTLDRIDSALAGPVLDSIVFGPESNLAKTNW